MRVIAFHPSQTVTGGRQVVSHQATCAGTLQLKGQPGGLCKPSAITEDAPIFFLVTRKFYFYSSVSEALLKKIYLSSWSPLHLSVCSLLSF